MKLKLKLNLKTIKHRRLRQKLTQAQMGTRIGVTRSGYANMENGYRPINSKYMRRIERALRPSF